jgi:hypothetical protein
MPCSTASEAVRSWAPDRCWEQRPDLARLRAFRDALPCGVASVDVAMAMACTKRRQQLGTRFLRYGPPLLSASRYDWFGQ